MLSGNRGEWSEAYVFLKLLADGKLYAADAKLDQNKTLFYPIIKIIRHESGRSREYAMNGHVTIIDGNSQAVLKQVPIVEFKTNSDNLLGLIKKSKGASFTAPTIEQFLKSIDITKLSALNTDKSDIKIVVHDLHTGLEPELGFSIKSMLGKNSTLFNPGNTTNFIYEIVGKNISNLDINKVNKIMTAPKIESRIRILEKKGFELVFRGVQSKIFELNLQLIDNGLPNILGAMLLLKYSGESGPNLKDLLIELKKINPHGFDVSYDHPFYEHKLKSFLTDTALGMTPSKMWGGQYSATGGMIIVKRMGEVLCYHIYNRSAFQDYLLNNTRLEQASMTRYKFGQLYKENGKVFMKLNLQVRFN